MANSFNSCYTELIALTQSHIKENYQPKERLFVNHEEYQYCLKHAQKWQQKKNYPKEEIKSSPLVTTPIKQALHEPIQKKQTSSISSPPVLAKTTQKTQPQPDSAFVEEKTPPLPLKKQENQIKKSTQDSKKFSIESLPAVQNLDIQDLKNLINERLPALKLLHTIPHDEEAKRLNTLWKQDKKPPQVVILSFDEIPMHYAFLTNLAHAINVYGYYTQILRARPLEQNNEWETIFTPHLKLVIGTHSKINTFSNLLKNYREAPKQGKHFLKNTPLIFLADIAFYLKESKLKLPLWKTIQELLGNVH